MMHLTETGPAAAPSLAQTTALLAAFLEFLNRQTAGSPALVADPPEEEEPAVLPMEGIMSEPTTDSDLARRYRQTFQEQLLPHLQPNAYMSAHNQPSAPDYWGTTGYLIDIAAFRQIAEVFANCEAVQICFGMDQPIAQGGQLQLVFRGHGGVAPGQLFLTPPPPTNDPNDPGTPPTLPRVKPCPPNAECGTT